MPLHCQHRPPSFPAPPLNQPPTLHAPECELYALARVPPALDSRQRVELMRWCMFPTPWTIDPSGHSSTITTGLLALLRHHAIRLLHCTYRSVISMRLSVELTTWTLHSSNRSSTFIIAVTTSCWVLCCISTCFYFYVSSIVSMYFLLFCLGFVGFSLPLYLGFNRSEEHTSELQSLV